MIGRLRMENGNPRPLHVPASGGGQEEAFNQYSSMSSYERQGAPSRVYHAHLATHSFRPDQIKPGGVMRRDSDLSPWFRIALLFMFLIPSGCFASLPGSWVWETPPTDCSPGGRSSNLHMNETGNVISGSWDEGDIHKVNNGKLSGVRLSSGTALIYLCDESGNGYYAACPASDREYSYVVKLDHDGLLVYRYTRGAN